MPVRQGPHLPSRIRLGVMKEKAELRSQFRGIRPFKTGAADHGVDLIMFDIGPDAAPKHFNGLFAPVIGQDARTSQFQKA